MLRFYSPVNPMGSCRVPRPNKLGKSWVPDAIYQDSASKLSWFWRRLSVFTIYGHGSHPVQWCITIQTNCQIPFQQMAPCEIRLKLLKRLQRRRYLHFTQFHACIYSHTWEFCVPDVHISFICLFVLRFYGPVNPMGSCRAQSVYLTTRLLGRLSPLSG